MTGLIDPNTPAVLDPAPHARLAGDWTDDDGIVNDETLEPAFNGPVESESQAYEKAEVPTPTRLLVRSITVGLMSDGVTIADPVQVFPADLNRKDLIITATGPVVIGSDKTDVYNGAALPGSTSWQSVFHTGAVWVYVPAATGSVVVTVWSVTK